MSQEISTTTLTQIETEKRSDRGSKTPFRIQALQTENKPFTDYEVVGESNITYIVEIRSLDERINSCSCPDFHVNKLHICKHIEGVLAWLQKQGKRRFNQHKKTGSPLAEIYLNPTSSKVCINWPKNGTCAKEVKKLLNPFLSANQTLISDPIIGISSIEQTLEGASPEAASKIRISSHLMSWVEDQKLRQTRERDRELFLQDIREGKRSLQMLTTKLFPYQEEGMLHLAFKGRAILADEMGLGKTIQAIAACELLRRLKRAERVLVITPASLKGEWQDQIERFTGLPTLLVQGSRPERLACYRQNAFFYLVNYEQVRNDFNDIQTIIHPDILVLDEAQRVKNWQTKTAWAVKQLKTPYAFVLTGTPIENRIEEIYSIMQLIDPKVLGPLYQFNRDFFELDSKGKPVGYIHLDKLHQKLSPYVLRRLKRDVETQLPERVVRNFLLKMSDEQQLRYDELVVQVSQMMQILKKRPFTSEESKKLQRLLACMRMIADTPYILDEECKESPKINELENILRDLFDNEDNKVIIFSEWERMLRLVKELLKKLNLDFAWHTGTVPQEKRREEIKRFKEDANCRLFLSTDSGSTGLNLQNANVVINLDLPWNPAKLEQRIARAWRKNQTRTVQVINLITENSIEQRMLVTLDHKRAVANAVLDASGEDAIALPSSSREEFIEKLEQLMGDIPIKRCDEPITDKSSSEKFSNNILSRYNDRIHLLEAHGSKMFVVVDSKDESLIQTIEELSDFPVEILDFDTYKTLQKLIDAGMIQTTSLKKEVLYHSHLIKNRERRCCPIMLQKASEKIGEAERKCSMAQLLQSNDFLDESLPPALEAYQLGVDTAHILELHPPGCTERLKQMIEAECIPSEMIPLLNEWVKKLKDSIIELAKIG